MGRDENSKDMRGIIQVVVKMAGVAQGGGCWAGRM